MNHSIALLFPGQGSQSLKMGKALYENYIEARHCFERVNNALNQDLTSIIFGDDLELLTRTTNAQPAIMATSMAVLSVLLKQGGYSDISKFASVVAGHSLGEYTALCASGAISLEDAAQLLRKRGEAMEYCAQHSLEGGGMVALLGVEDISLIEDLARDAAIFGGVCQIANDNGAGQFVLSGTNSAMKFVEENAKSFGCTKAIRLNVSGAFHSSMLENSKPILINALKDISISRPYCDIIANTTATRYCKKQRELVDDKSLEADRSNKINHKIDEFNKDNEFDKMIDKCIFDDINDSNANSAMPIDGEAIKEELVKQICGRVRWRETMNYIEANYQMSAVAEIGPGRALSNLYKKSHQNREVIAANDPTSIEQLLTFLARSTEAF